MIRRFILCGIAAVFLIVATSAKAPAPAPVPPPDITSTFPTKIPPHPPTPVEARPYFDWFAWEEFIALNFPAAVDSKTGLPQRGVPAPNSKPGTPGTRVWETWKANWETFRPNESAPTDWSSWDVVPPSNPCSGPALTASSNAKGRLIVMESKMDSILSGFNEAFSGPLVAQNKTYARYEVKLNETEYSQIQVNGWYKKASFPPLINFLSTPWFGEKVKGAPYGAIELKAAWKELTGADNPARYYTIYATVLEPGPKPTCRPNVRLGLVGMHIIHKIAPFREWVWSTFEQIDNVPDPSRPKPATGYSFNNGTPNPPTPSGYAPPAPNPHPPNTPFPPPAQRTAMQVTRLTPVPADTRSVNATFQKALVGTPFQYYELTANQWPTLTGHFDPNGSYPAGADTPFPNDHVANTTAETYLQSDSCIGCHYLTAATDFSFIFPSDFGSQVAAARNLGASRGALQLKSVRDKLKARVQKQEK